MVLFIFTLFSLGWYMTDLPKGPERSALFALHKSIGLTVAWLWVLRLAWRLSHTPPPLPASVPFWARKASQINHWLLYVFMFVQPLSGYLSSSFSGYTSAYFGLPLPDWGWKDEALNTVFSTLHVVSSYVLLSLIGLHVLAALKHLIIDRDGVFRRILP
jgi:Cytochrome B561